MLLTGSHLQLGIFISWAVFFSCWVIMISFYAILLWTTKGYYGNLNSFSLFTFFEQVVSLAMWGKWHWNITWKSAPNCFCHSWVNVKLRFFRQSDGRVKYFKNQKKFESLISAKLLAFDSLKFHPCLIMMVNINYFSINQHNKVMQNLFPHGWSFQFFSNFSTPALKKTFHFLVIPLCKSC